MVATSKTIASSEIREERSEAPRRDPPWPHYFKEPEKIYPAAFADDPEKVLPDISLQATTAVAEDSAIAAAAILRIYVVEEKPGKAKGNSAQRTGWQGDNRQGHGGAREQCSREARGNPA